MRYSPAKKLERAHVIMGQSEDAAVPRGKRAVRLGAEKHVSETLGQITSELLYAGLTPEYLRTVALHSALAGMACGVVALVSGVSLIVVLALVVPVVHWFRVKSMAARRALSFERDYTAFLLALASSVRAGLDPLNAMIKCVELFPKDSEVRSAISKLKVDIDSGRTEEAAFGRFAEDIRHPDIGLFSTAIVLARREGSSLGGCLERLARVTRQRQSFRRKTRAAVAMQRMSAIGLAFIAILIIGIQFIGNPESLRVALATDFGFRAMTIGTLAIVSGIIWMIRLARTRI